MKRIRGAVLAGLVVSPAANADLWFPDFEIGTCEPERKHYAKVRETAEQWEVSMKDSEEKWLRARGADSSDSGKLLEVFEGYSDAFRESYELMAPAALFLRACLRAVAIDAKLDRLLEAGEGR